MKTRKFTRVISFILSIAFVFSTVAIKASAYSTETISYDCPKSLCTEDLVISGAYGDPDEIIDSEVPYFGGMTLQDVMDNRNITNKDYHLHIFYCPKFDINDASLFRHTMTLMFAQHGYTTKSYSQYNEYYHYANKQCDHAKEINGSYVHALTQELCGENALIDNETLNELIIYQGQFGCGKETAVLETHTWSYGDWVDNGDGTCSRIVSCSDCGYSETVTQIHDLSYSDWEWDSNDSDRGATHKRTITCSKCSYEEIVSQSHDDYWVWIEDSWEPSGNDGCTRSKKCSVCGKTVFIYNKHQFSTTNYVCLSDTQHEQTLTCYLCGTTRTEIKNHGYTSTVYEPYSETQHKYSKTCFCDYVSITYSDHRDNNSDLYCDDCGYNMTRFSVTLPTTMSFVMSKTGEVYSADTVKLFNNSTAPVSVKQVRLETVNGWSLTKYDEKGIASAKVDSKLIGFKLKNAETSSSGQTETLNFTDWSISKGVYQSFTYDAVISATSVPIENEQIMNVIFIVDWKE